MRAAKNQYTGGSQRTRRLPTMAVSELERRLVEDAAVELRLTMAQLVRCGLVLLGVLDTSSLDDLPEAIAAQVSRGKGLGPITKGVHP